MPPNEIEMILKAIEQLDEKLSPALTLIAVHTEQIMTVKKEVTEYKKEQVPKCDDRFDVIFKKFSKVNALLLSLVIILLIASLSFSGNLAYKFITNKANAEQVK